MFDIVKKLLLARQLKMEKGSFDLLGLPVLVIPVPVIVEMQKILEETVGYEKMHKELYDSSKSGTHFYAKGISEKHGMKGRELIKWLLDILMLTGFGEAELLKLDIEKKHAVVKMTNSAIPKYYKIPQKHPVDHIICGAQAGGSSFVFGEEMLVEEVKCMAQGHPYCEFVYKPIDSKNKIKK